MFLLKSAPASLVAQVTVLDMMYPAWAGLGDVISRGTTRRSFPLTHSTESIVYAAHIRSFFINTFFMLFSWFLFMPFMGHYICQGQGHCKKGGQTGNVDSLPSDMKSLRISDTRSDVIVKATLNGDNTTIFHSDNKNGVYGTRHKQETFLKAMQLFTATDIHQILAAEDFSQYGSICDLGGKKLFHFLSDTSCVYSFIIIIIIISGGFLLFQEELVYWPITCQSSTPPVT